MPMEKRIRHLAARKMFRSSGPFLPRAHRVLFLLQAPHRCAAIYRCAALPKRETLTDASSANQIHPDYRERFFSPDLSSNSNHSSSDRLTPSPWGIPPPTSPKLDDEPWSSTSSQASARSKSSNPKAAVAFDEKQRPRPFYAISQPAALPPALNLLSPRMKELLDTPQAWLVCKS